MEKEHSEVKLNQILSAAQKRFGHYGLSKTTMNEIADDIGMCKASLYYYFKDKESIFLAVAGKEQEYFIQEMNKIIHSSFDTEKMLLGYIDLRIKLLKTLLTLGKFSCGSYVEVKPLLSSLSQKFRKEEMNMIAGIIKIGIKRKEFSLENIEMNAEFLIDALRGLSRVAYLGYEERGLYGLPPKEDQKLKQQTHLLTKFFIKGISIKET